MRLLNVALTLYSPHCENTTPFASAPSPACPFIKAL